MKSWPIGKTKSAKETGLEGLIQRELARTVYVCEEGHWPHQGVWRWGKEKRNKTDTGAMGNQTTHHVFQPLFDLFFNIQRKWIWLYHLLPRCCLTNKWTDVTPYSCKGKVSLPSALSWCLLLTVMPALLFCGSQLRQCKSLLYRQSFVGIEKYQEC